MPWYLRKLMIRGGFMDAADDNGGAGTGGDGGSSDDGAGSGAGADGDSGSGSGDSSSAGAGGDGDSGAGEGGKKGPSDAEAKLLKELMGKKTALKDTQAKLDAASAITKQIEELGGLDALKELVKAKKDAETADLEAKGQWDKLRAQMLEAHTKDLEAKDGALKGISEENSKLKATIAELTVGNAFASSSFIKDDMTIPVSKVRALYGSHFEFSESGVVAYDKPAGFADRTMLVDGKGEPLKFEEAIKKIIDIDPDRDQLIRSKAKPGAGSSTAPKSGAPTPATEQKTGIDKITAGLASVVAKK